MTFNKEMSLRRAVEHKKGQRHNPEICAEITEQRRRERKAIKESRQLNITLRYGAAYRSLAYLLALGLLRVSFNFSSSSSSSSSSLFNFFSPLLLFSMPSLLPLPSSPLFLFYSFFSPILFYYIYLSIHPSPALSLSLSLSLSLYCI